MAIRGGLPSDDESVSIEELPTDALQYIIHHVFLPPKLPQEDDSDTANDFALTNQVLATLRALNAIQGHASSETAPLVTSIAMIENMINSRATNGRLLEEVVHAQMGSMKRNGKQLL
jgi:hypothetical protein